ncbi:MAG: hypothetical protein R3F14_19390 [Polyangiaceae bacterium]
MDDEGNPIDTQAPDDSPPPEPPPPPLDEPPERPERDEDRLSKQVPIGLLFLAATVAVALILGLVAVMGFAALKP